MVGSFACPECFSLIATRGATPGRRVRCGECGTVVEVPYLARGSAPARRRSGQPVWVYLGLGAAVVLLLIAAAVRFVRSHGERARSAEIAAHVEAADHAEQAEQYDQALAELDAALPLVRNDPERAGRDLRDRRDRMARRVAESLLERAASPGLLADRSERDRVIGSLRSLRNRASDEPALEPLRARIMSAAHALIAQGAEDDLRAAEAALQAGDSTTALALCEATARAAKLLTSDRSGPTQQAAEAMVRRVVERCGVLFDPVRGQFLADFEGAKGYARTIHPIVATAMTQHGLAPKPESSRFAAIWDEAAPYRLDTEISERFNGVFYSSPIRTSALAAHLILRKGSTVVWQANAVGKSRIPPPKMTAFESSRYALAKARDPKAEEILYRDAQTVVADGLTSAFRNLPAP